MSAAERWDSGYLHVMFSALVGHLGVGKKAYRTAIIARCSLYQAARYRYVADASPHLRSSAYDALAGAVEAHARAYSLSSSEAADRWRDVLAVSAVAIGQVPPFPLSPECVRDVGFFADLCATMPAGLQEWPCLSGMWQALALREVFGNPWDQVGRDAVAPYVTAEAQALAASLDDSRGERGGRLERSALLVLADMLEEAGCPSYVTCPTCNGTGFTSNRPPYKCSRCTDAHLKASGVVPHPLLCHLRQGTYHPMGCWAVDLVAGYPLPYVKK